MQTLLCNTTNYRVSSRGKDDIDYIVIHYTANNGDTAQGNCSYFSRTGNLQASAHYFVDENETLRSVEDRDIAWHCGANTYLHKYCRNANSLGIEICSRKDASGRYYFLDETVRRAAELTLSLMEEYSIPAENVVRHYDVTGKICPAPFVNDETQWLNFKERLEMTQDKFDLMLESYLIRLSEKDPADWSAEAREWAESNGIIFGSGDVGMQYKSFCTREQMTQFLYRMSLRRGEPST